jgi:dTDP-4-dehydrorhamnose reductase
VAAPNILVLGASGMLGSAVFRTLSAATGWTVYGTQKSDPAAPSYLDILKMACEAWSAELRRRPFRYVVNCVGILKAAVDERDAASLKRAISVNALFPHELATALPDARILHMSTDGVFAEEQERPYVETDASDCRDAYGKTKALGECPALNVLNFRCSIVGRDEKGGKGLLERVLRSADGETLTGFDDQLWNGVTTNQFAELCLRVIRSDSFDRLREISGVYHFCPNPPITKYDLLCRMRTAAARGLTIRRDISGRPSRRVLETLYKAVGGLFPGGGDWDSLLREAIQVGVLPS